MDSHQINNLLTSVPPLDEQWNTSKSHKSLGWIATIFLITIFSAPRSCFLGKGEEILQHLTITQLPCRQWWRIYERWSGIIAINNTVYGPENRKKSSSPLYLLLLSLSLRLTAALIHMRLGILATFFFASRSQVYIEFYPCRNWIWFCSTLFFSGVGGGKKRFKRVIQYK